MTTLVRLLRPLAFLAMLAVVLLAGTQGVAWATPDQQPGQTVPKPTPKPKDDDGGSDAPGDGVVTSPPGAPAGTSQARVPPRRPATIPTGDGKTVLNIPAGAFAVPGTVQATPLTVVPPPAPGFQLFGPAVSITFFDEQGSLIANPVLLAPVSISFALDPAALAGIDLTTVVVQVYDQATFGWVSLPTVVDPLTGQVTVTTQVLGTFAVMQGPAGAGAGAVPPAAAGGGAHPLWSLVATDHGAAAPTPLWAVGSLVVLSVGARLGWRAYRRTQG